jgi:predicted permease
MRSFMRRVQYLLRHRQHQADLDEEMALHREMLARGRAGERATAFGNAALAREDARAVWIAPWCDSVWQDLAYAVRSLRRQPAFAVCAIGIVALGTGAVTGVFGLLDQLSVRSLPVHRPDRLVWFQSPAFSYPVFKLVQERVPVFDGFFGWNLDRAYVDWTGRDGEMVSRDLLEATPEFFTTLGVRAAIGRTFTAGDTTVAVLSHRAWTRHFGADPTVVGRTIRVATQPYTIIGVAPAEFFGVAPGLDPELFVPIHGRRPASAFASTTASWLHFMGRLKDGVSREQANAALQVTWPSIMEVTIDERMNPERRAVFLGRRTALEDGRTGFSRVRNQFDDPLRMLMGLVALLLAIGCASIANLLLARGVARRKEIAIRIALGASRRRVFRQLVTEALVLTLAGAALGLLIASWSGSAIVTALRTSTNGLTIDATPGWRTIGFITLLAVAVSIAAAWLPALGSTRSGARDALRETGQTGSGLLRRLSSGKVLVGLQVALAVILLAAAAMFGRSLSQLLAQGSSLDSRRLIVLTPDPVAAGLDTAAIDQFHAALIDRLRAVPGVASVALAWKAPISFPGGSWTQTIAIDGGPPVREQTPSVFFNSVSPGYFATIGLELRRGRDISPQDTASSPFVTVVNETLARQYFSGTDPIGHRISIGLTPALQNVEIVGVVPDTKYRTLQEPQRRIAYLAVAQHAVVRTGGDRNLVAVLRVVSDAATASLRQAAREVDSRVPVRIESVADRIRESTLNERILAGLATGLGVIALALASAGLYGLLAYAVSRHAREIGLRMALGARPSAVLWMVQRESIVLAGAGILAGLGAALALGRFARALLFQVTPNDPLALAGAAMLMLFVAGCAAFIPARRAALVDPIVALKRDS